jgi:hypothetical protein
VSALPDIDRQLGSDPSLLGDELLGLIRAAMDNAPRTLQRAIGPSEIGSPCALKIGHKLAGTAPCNASPYADGLKATFGTGMHSWLAETFAVLNAGWPARWLIEQRVDIAHLPGLDLAGTCDLFDRVSATVVDWKTTTVKRIRDYRANGPGQQYRIQAHCYGLGWVNRGEPVERVALLFIPRDGLLSQSYYWTEDYDPALALAAAQRVSGIATALALAPVADVLRMLPRAADYCTFCPYYRTGATDRAEACPGADI